MPRIRLGETRTTKTWQQIIIDQIKADRAIPVLSNSISNDLILGNHRQLILDFAEHTKYPLVDKDNLAHLTQFMTVVEAQSTGPMSAIAIKQAYLDYAKSRLCDLAEASGAVRSLLDEVNAEFDDLNFSELARRLSYPKFADTPQDDPLLVLADLDLSLYLTTGYHQVMEAALRKAGKQPRTGVCRWNKQLEDDIPNNTFAGGYKPSPQEPLVYHLHGLDTYPDSLVLTEDDYLKYLVAISQDKYRIPAVIHAALAKSSLLLLGYDLQNWEFRTLFWGLLEPRPREPQKQGISVLYLQLDCCEAEQKYLQTYLHKADLEVFRGSIYEYTGELFKALFQQS